jgi:multisubunit Na+/H+ antiporter MnhF subunit
LESGLRIDVDKTLSWGAAGLFGVSMFLPAVNLDPWLPGFNLPVLSFYGMAVFLLFGFSSVFDGATNGDWSFGFCLLRFVVCLVGASANVLMITTFVRIVRGRRVPSQVAALSLALTLAAAGALCFLSKRSIDETLSYGYFAWAGCAALLLVASLNQSPRMLPKGT